MILEPLTIPGQPDMLHVRMADLVVPGCDLAVVMQVGGTK